jgi:hypothetical protein
MIHRSFGRFRHNGAGVVMQSTSANSQKANSAKRKMPPASKSSTTATVPVRPRADPRRPANLLAPEYRKYYIALITGDVQDEEAAMAVAIITGASKGFGRALAEDLAGDGWDLVLDARHAGELEATARALREHGTQVRAIAGDVSDAAHREQLVAAANALGGLDLLVNNASTLGPTPMPFLRYYPVDEFARVYEVNVVAPLALVQRALPLLHASRGVIVGITSDAGVEGYEGWGGYG